MSPATSSHRVRESRAIANRSAYESTVIKAGNFLTELQRTLPQHRVVALLPPPHGDWVCRKRNVHHSFSHLFSTKNMHQLATKNPIKPNLKVKQKK